MDSGLSLTDSFKKYFDIHLADSEELRNLVYSIRYHVYCEEFKYEPSASFANELECDEYDSYSLHCVIVHKSTGKPAGCVRLVPAVDKVELPFEKYCSESIDKSFIEKLQLDRDGLCEISRLAVDGAFRRRVSEARTRFGEVDSIDCSRQERRTFPLISLVAFLAATALTDLTGKGNVFAMMEPFLPRMLEKSGISFQRAGADMDYHGSRAPYFARTEEALKNMNSDLYELYEYVHDCIKEQYDVNGQYLDWNQKLGS